MHTLSTVPASAPSGWLFGIAAVLIGGAVVPFLLSVVPDAVALLVQRRRWQLLAGLVVATVAALGALNRTLALAMTTDNGYLVDWPEVVQLLFVVGLVVALWHGLPRVMRSILRRRREDQARLPVLTAALPLAEDALEAPALVAEPLPA